MGWDEIIMASYFIVMLAFGIVIGGLNEDEGNKTNNTRR